MLRSWSRLPATTVIVAAGLVVVACSNPASGNASNSNTSATSGTTSSTSAMTKYVSAKATAIGGSTAILLDPAVSAALERASITVTAIAPATRKTTLRFPVSGGQIVVATLAGVVDHTGGLTFRHSVKSATLTNFVINTSTRQLTATVGGQSMPIFDLTLPSPQPAGGSHRTVVASHIKLTVTSQAAIALNSGLGVTIFLAGMNFGIATITVAYARGHR